MKNENIALSITKVLLFIAYIAVSISIIITLYNMIRFVGYPYVNEIREVANIDIGNLISKGINPYTIENFQPHMYVYGVSFQVLVALVSKIIGESFTLLSISRFFSFFFIFSSAIILGIEIFKSSKEKSYLNALIGMSIFLSSMYISARPDSMAIFIQTVIFFIINRLQNSKQIFLVACLTVILFYTKQYFVLSYIVVLIFLLFKNRNQFLYYLFTVPIIFITSAIIVNYFFPMYFPENIIHHLTMQGSSLKYMAYQSYIFISRYWLLIGILIYTIFIQVKNFNFKSIKLQIKQNTPIILLENTILKNIYFIATITSFLVITLKLGQHEGAFMTYYYQLLLPPFIIISFVLFSNYANSKFKSINIIISILVLTYSFIFSIYQDKYYQFNNGIFNKESQENWSKAIKIIDEYKSEKIYLSSMLSSYAINKDLPMYDNGMTEYGSTTKSSNIILNTIFPITDLVETKVNSSKIDLNNKVKNKEFKLITYIPSFPNIDPDILKNNYQLVEIIPLKESFSTWQVEFWIPK